MSPLHINSCSSSNSNPEPCPSFSTNTCTCSPPSINKPSPLKFRTRQHLLKQVSPELGKLIQRDLNLLDKIGWQALLTTRVGRKDIGSLKASRTHPAHYLLHHFKYHGVPVTLSCPPWTIGQCDKAVQRGPHPSTFLYQDFLNEEFLDMINKGQ